MNRQIILASRPNGFPAEENFKMIEKPERKPEHDEVLCQTIYLSLDPYMRGRMNDAKSYAEPVKVGGVMAAGAVGQVIESRSSLFQPGDFVECRPGWQERPTLEAKDLRKLYPDQAPISTAIGVLGMPGITAYVGMVNIADPRPGETLVVGAASGAVGATVGQIGKIFGCHVIGIAGTDEKCSYVTETCNFDACINYNEDDFQSQLATVCPKGVDIYWENVGGKTFDAVFPLLNDFARIPVCGLISAYNKVGLFDNPDRLPVLFRSVLTKRLLIRGFIVFDFDDQKLEALQKLSVWVKDEKIIYKENFVDGLENAPGAFLGLFRGTNFGKLIVRVSPDPSL